MALPLAPFPPLAIRSSIPATDWLAILNTWTSALTHLLQLPSSKFTSSTLTPNLHVFLSSYLSHAAVSTTSPDLHKKVFQLLHRLLSLPAPPKELFDSKGEFLLSFASQYSRTTAARELLESLWTRTQPLLDTAVSNLKRQVLSSHLRPETASHLTRLFTASPHIAASFLAGDEFQDAAATTSVVAKLYARALMEACSVNWSVVIDELYGLATSGGLLARSLAELGVGEKLVTAAEAGGDRGITTRAKQMAEKLRAIAPVKLQRVKKDKGKGKARAVVDEEAEMQTQSAVESIRDLFPELGTGFVRSCLAALENDVEAVTSALLDDALPSTVASLDRDEPYIPPDSTPPPTSVTLVRRNIHDNDALDRLSPLVFHNLTLGRRTQKTTADTLLNVSRPSKSSILAALATLDPDDDERDDTYDAADIGDSVDPSTAEADDSERATWSAYKAFPEIFTRDARGSDGRRRVKNATGWTDEALEGFASMIGREPERARKLEKRYREAEEPGQGQRAVIERSRWQEGDEVQIPERGRKSRGIAGGGAGVGGRRGGGPEREKGQQSEGKGRAKKEQNKARAGNHNRRDQRARKVARGFGGAPPA